MPLAEKPVFVATVMNEKVFDEDHHLIHKHTVFFEDQMHDWNWENGRFRYYSRVSEKSDVLVVYDMADVVPEPKFDAMTGKPLPKKQIQMHEEKPGMTG